MPGADEPFPRSDDWVEYKRAVMREEKEKLEGKPEASKS